MVCSGLPATPSCRVTTGLRDTSHARDDDYLDAGTGIDLVRGGGGTDTMLDDASEVGEHFGYWADWVDAV